MTLHAAIIQVLQSKGRAMSTQEIADELNENKWYQKKDNSVITAYQIHGRTKNYPNLFVKNGSMISLKKQSVNSSFLPGNKKTEKLLQKVSDGGDISFELAEKMLMNEKNFRSAGKIDNIVPDSAGLYCIRINAPKNLPVPFSSEIEKRNHNIVYIGIATQSLEKRMLNQELRAIGHGTFFRSIGAILGYRPLIGSLIEKKNKRNYKFEAKDNTKIIQWINENLRINWVKFNQNLEDAETMLILKYKPILNIAKNPFSISELSELRKQCVDIANKKPGI